MEKETRTLKQNEAYRIAGDWMIDDLDYEVVERQITGSDYEDGGTDYRLIVKEKSTGKFFEMEFTEWDVSNTEYIEETDTVGERCDLDCDLCEVFPETVTTVIYK